MKPRIIVFHRNRPRPRLLNAQSQEEFEKESKWLFLIELLIFGVLTAVSAWPIIHTAEALQLL